MIGYSCLNIRHSLSGHFAGAKHCLLLWGGSDQLFGRPDWTPLEEEIALPLLQKASACDPERFEIAYGWMQAVRHTSTAAATAAAVSRVLEQSQWSKDEQHMLEQLNRPLAN
jgi:hypothetical protein